MIRQLKLVLTDHPGGKPVTALIALGLVLLVWGAAAGVIALLA